MTRECDSCKNPLGKLQIHMYPKFTVCSYECLEMFWQSKEVAAYWKKDMKKIEEAQEKLKLKLGKGEEE